MKSIAIGISAVIIALLIEQYCDRPLIREIAIESVRDLDGWLLVYRYAVNGDESTVILRDDAELEEYRAYLRKFGSLSSQREEAK